MSTYKPIWSRPPNKFIRYENRNFDDLAGHTAVITYAIYLDKNKVEKEIEAFIKWNST